MAIIYTIVIIYYTHTMTIIYVHTMVIIWIQLYITIAYNTYTYNDHYIHAYNNTYSDHCILMTIIIIITMEPCKYAYKYNKIQ